MTNPSNIVRFHSRNGGRASSYEANASYQVYDTGLLFGNGVISATGLNITVGGSTSNPDIVIAQNPAGYKFALDLIGAATLTLTAPVSNSKKVAIVAYTDDPSVVSTEDTVTGNPGSCGLIVIDGAASATPTEPDDTTIRAAITADGATGSQAIYAVIAVVTVSSTTTDITDSLIENKNAFFIRMVPESQIDSLVGTSLPPNHFIFGYKES